MKIFGNEVVKTLSFKLSLREKLITDNGDIFPLSAVLWEFVKNRV